MTVYSTHMSLLLSNERGLPPSSGEDWQLAKSQGSSSLHILPPTGLQLQLKQSIVKKDAYLPRYYAPVTRHTMYLCYTVFF